MKAGSRALGVAWSDGDDRSVLCGAVVRADRVVDGVALGSCSVGGDDATAAVAAVFSELGREDVQYLLLSGVAPAWFNLVDLDALHEAVDRPVLSVSFEASPGLDPALREQFDGDALAARLATYERLPDRRPVAVNDETVYVRAVGVDADEAGEVVRGFTPEGGRPEPVRVARLAARAGRAWSEREGFAREG
ncbi:DUF99 family protein [Halobium salinum]|uniref:UPF0215 protein ACFO0N_09935 n=1 Tax=Halobium salinum TaxID=1364940 RepID=A0ABD5PBK9_9EURY|nr:DUF99 family protein [Halobium salinum]